MWRHAVSKHGKRHGLNLGPYCKIIEGHLFGDAALSMDAFIGRSNLLDPNGKRVEIGLAPYKRRVLKWTIWHFSIAGFDFYIKTDQQPFPRQWREFLANDNDPITIPVIDPLHLHQIPMLKPLFSQMMKKSG